MLISKQTRSMIIEKSNCDNYSYNVVLKNKVLFNGTKTECKNYIKRLSV